MDLESELKKLLNGRAASNETPEPVVVEEAVVVKPAYAEWTPAPWHREDWRQRDPFGDFMAA